MGTRSLTYVYDDLGKVIIKMYLQFDGYLSGYGLDLAKFLKSYAENPDNSLGYGQKDIDMEKLAGNIVSHFFHTKGEYPMIISPFCNYYCRQEYEYHIYLDMIRIVEYDEKEYEANWKTDEFEQLCSQ